MTAVGPNVQPLYSATEAVTLPPEAAATGSSTARETLVRSSTWVLNSSVSFEWYSLRDDRRVLQTASSLGISMVPRRVLTELHRDSSYPMMGKEAWVAGADRGEAPGPKPGHLGRRLRLRHQPPGSWQFLNGGVQRGVSFHAGLSLRHGLHVMTRNTRHFVASGALVLDPWQDGSGPL